MMKLLERRIIYDQYVIDLYTGSIKLEIVLGIIILYYNILKRIWHGRNSPRCCGGV